MELKELRKRNNFTQQECAEMFNVSRRTYQSIENRESDSDEDKYNYFCEVLESNLAAANNESENKLKTNVTTGDGLVKFIDKIRSYNSRYLIKYLKDYISNDYGPRVCVLYGLRRTGKTTMLFQLLRDLDLTRTAYIKLDINNTMGDLISDINTLYAKGIKYLLIDEVTLLEDFINTSATLSDIYCAKGMKIILSGTDSLGFAFAQQDELYDRCLMIHTSYISYKEFSSVLGIKDIDEYIEYGGTMKKENKKYSDAAFNGDDLAFKSDESTRKYIDTAICSNIQRSLKNTKFGARFAYVKELFDQNELTNAINRVVEDMNHDFLVSVVTEKFKSHDLGSARQMLTFSKLKKVQTALYDIDENKVLDSLKNIIGVKEKEQLKVQVTQEMVKQIKEYLYMLDLIQDVEVRYGDGRIVKRPIFSQPGMRYSITKALVYSLQNDAYIQSLSPAEQSYIFEKIMSDVKGRMLEDIVLLERTRNKKPNEMVFKYITFDKGEYDMVVYDYDTNSFELYEIKHTKTEAIDYQAKNLNNTELFKQLSKGVGEIKDRCILYRGDHLEKKGISFMSVEYYLEELGPNKY